MALMEKQQIFWKKRAGFLENSIRPLSKKKLVSFFDNKVQNDLLIETFSNFVPIFCERLLKMN